VADLTVTNPNNQAGVQLTAQNAAASDRFPVGFGQKYGLEIINTSGASRTVTLDDPDANNPLAYKALNRDVDVVLATNQTRIYIVDGSRFRDATGWCNISVNTASGVAYNIFGPL
jgi:hypothetical protein